MQYRPGAAFFENIDCFRIHGPLKVNHGLLPVEHRPVSYKHRPYIILASAAFESMFESKVSTLL